MRFDKDFIRTALEAEPRCVEAVVTLLGLMAPGDEFVTSTGKIQKTGKATFKLVIDEEVVSRNIETAFNELGNPIDRLFENTE